ncbi:MAG TPA: hypothetical protein VHD56_16495 [Tepidisphaeraceae bacterium]|nr:hypothetical protein [Tepidisphaeraceae bacterium]
MALREQAILMLDKRGGVLETAQRISALLKDHHIRGAIIGGVAVVLHGHLRTTRDVDVLVPQPLEDFRPILESAGVKYSAGKREFILDSIPIHLVDEKMVQPPPTKLIEIDHITTVSLVDLINMKLRTGLAKTTRAQDIADVIGLIRRHKLTGAFSSKIDRSLRSEFRKLATAVQRDS